MKTGRFLMAALCACIIATPATAGIISADEYVDDAAFSAATGAVSLTGAIPNIGAQGTSVTLGGATLSAGNTIFVGSGWSTLLPGGNAIAISGPENLDISVDTGLATAFGFYFHEPANSRAQLDGCNATCVNSTFAIEFFLGATYVDGTRFTPPDDVAYFAGIILDEVFDSVRFTEVVGGIDNEFFGEMYVARVSEPAGLLLLGSGLLALGLFRRRRPIGL